MGGKGGDEWGRGGEGGMVMRGEGGDGGGGRVGREDGGEGEWEGGNGEIGEGERRSVHLSAS